MSDKCPKCGSDAVERDAVDVGVGTIYGPLGCLDCGWVEQPEPLPAFDASIDDAEEPSR